MDLTEEEQLKFEAWIMWSKNHADRLNPINKSVNYILS